MTIFMGWLTTGAAEIPAELDCVCGDDSQRNNCKACWHEVRLQQTKKEAQND